MTAISFDQFIRGFTALRHSFGRRTAINIAALESGWEDFDVGTDPIVYELQRQLEERCGDVERVATFGTMISYGLWECLECTPGPGIEPFRVHDGASVWRWWEVTVTGPFAVDSPSQITFEQFERGFDALKASYARRCAVEQAAIDGGHQDFNLGFNPVEAELEEQLVERCGDKRDDNGPWPADSYGEGDISLAIHFGDTRILDEDGAPILNLTTAKEVWAMWERTKTGPFRKVPL